MGVLSISIAGRAATVGSMFKLIRQAVSALTDWVGVTDVVYLDQLLIALGVVCFILAMELAVSYLLGKRRNR